MKLYPKIFSLVALISGANTSSGKPYSSRKLLGFLLAVPIVLGVSLQAFAATDTWSGSVSGTWDTTTLNWNSGASAYTGGDDALFTGTPVNNVTAAAGLTIGAITLDSTFTGSVTMSGGNTMTSATTISGGTLNLNNVTGLGTSAVTVNSGGTLAINPGTASSTVANSFSGSGTITVQDPAGAAGNTLTLSGDWSGFTGILNILAGTSNNGKVTFSAATQAGVMSSSATVQIRSGATLYLTKALNYGASVQLFGSGNAENLGALRIEGGANQTGTVTLMANSFIGDNSGSATIGGIIGESGGSFGFTKVGSGTLVLTNLNTYSGTTTINAGTVSVAGDHSLGSGSVALNGATLSAAAAATVTNNFTLSGAVAFNAASGNLAISSGVSGTSRNVTFSGANSVTLGGSNYISTTAVNFCGPVITGNLIVTNSTTFTGAGFTDFRGYLTQQGNSTITILPGGSLAIITSSGSGLNSIVGQNLAGTSTLLANGGSFSLNGNSGFGLGNNINTAAGVLTVTNGGLVTLTAGSTILQDIRNMVALGRDNATGIINLDGGTLATGRQFVRDGSSGGTVGAGTATFNFNGGTLQAQASQTAGSGWFETNTTGNFQVVTTIVKDGGAIIDNNGFDVNINTVLAHGGVAATDGGLTKVGSGTMTLSAANTYTGGTTVSNGTLIVNGSIGAGAVTVTNAALGGVGTIAGATTLLANSILAPGTNNIGTLTFSSSLTLNATSTNDFVVTANGASNKVAVASLLTPNSSVVKITSGSALPLGTNTLFTYGTISGSFAATPVFDVAPVHTASIVDDGAGHINLVVPNNAPVAATYNVTRNSGINTLKIALSDLATNWTDADGDTISFVSANASTNGVTISTNGGYILYTNANNVNDQFTYTISDSLGATATGIVNITVISGSGSQNIASEQINGNGTVTLNLAGIPGYIYRTQATTNLITGPWIDISTNTAGTNGLWQVNDSDATNYPSRYYRTVYP